LASLVERESSGGDAQRERVYRLDVLVRNEQGIHARPAAKLAQEAQKFVAGIKLVCGKQTVDAKSILDILTLAVPHGGEVYIEAEGQDAAQAVDHLGRFFEQRLGEDT